METCRCYTLQGKPCTHRAKYGMFCGIHRRCAHRLGVKGAAKAAVQEGIQKKKAYLQQTLKKGVVSTQDRRQMLQECGKECCPLGTRQKDCKYAVCKPGSCTIDCDRVRSAKLKNNLAHKRSKTPDQAMYAYLKQHLAGLYQKNCKKA